MEELWQKVYNAVVGRGIKKVAVAVSGGRDSMCLLHAALHSGLDKSAIVVVHVNHNLRDEAAGDCEFVRAYCDGCGVKFFPFSVDVKGESARTGHTIEQAARNLRYGIFAELISSGQAEAVLTAHHALDNAETALMHLFRGSGLDGMGGIRQADARGIIRPLSDVYPDELEAYRARHNIPFVVDKTNFCDDADRNFIRLKVLPLILSRYRGAVRAINEFSAECARVSEYLTAEAPPTVQNGAVIISLDELSGALNSRAVRRALAYFSLVDITRKQVERVIDLARSDVGSRVELSGGLIAAREYDGVAIYLDRPKFGGEIPLSMGANYIDGLAVDVQLTDCAPNSLAGGIVDLDRIAGAVLRFRREGDMFTPLGGKPKKLKRFFIDSKIPKRLRGRIPLVCVGNEVLVAVGVQVSDLVKVTKSTVRRGAIKLRW